MSLLFELCHDAYIILLMSSIQNFYLFFIVRNKCGSGIYWTTDEQRQMSEKSKEMYQAALNDKFGDGAKTISTEIMQMSDEHNNTRFWMGEDYHQQYDAKPVGQPYCGLSPIGVSLPGPITL